MRNKWRSVRCLCALLLYSMVRVTTTIAANAAPPPLNSHRSVACLVALGSELVRDAVIVIAARALLGAFCARAAAALPLPLLPVTAVLLALTELAARSCVTLLMSWLRVRLLLRPVPVPLPPPPLPLPPVTTALPALMPHGCCCGAAAGAAAAAAV